MGCSSNPGSSFYNKAARQENGKSYGMMLFGRRREP